MKNLALVFFLAGTLFASCNSKSSDNKASSTEAAAAETPAMESPSPEPELKVWKLESYGAPGEMTEAPADMEITLTMDLKENRISGKAACNNYNGQMEGTGVGMVISTKMACPEPMMNMETTYLQMLEQVTASSIEGDKLVMTLDDGRQLVFGS